MKKSCKSSSGGDLLFNPCMEKLKNINLISSQNIVVYNKNMAKKRGAPRVNNSIPESQRKAHDKYTAKIRMITSLNICEIKLKAYTKEIKKNKLDKPTIKKLLASVETLKQDQIIYKKKIKDLRK
jgi:hypothetical protein